MIFVPVVAALLVIAVLLLLRSVRASRLEYEQKFPPISDDEFVALCGPGTNREIALKVRRIVSDQVGIAYDRIHPSDRFVDDYGMD